MNALKSFQEFICSGITFCPSGASVKVAHMIDGMTKNEVKELLQCMYDNFREPLGESHREHKNIILRVKFSFPLSK
jgi:hypothetical protein